MDELSVLAEIQKKFSAFLYSQRPTKKEEKWIEEFLVVESLAVIGERLRVYRNNLKIALIEALKDTYCLTMKILGKEAFEAIAYSFIYKSPSANSDLSQYGEGFWNCFDKNEGDKRNILLGDFAHLEWLWNQCLFKKEDAVLTFSDLQGLLDRNPDTTFFQLRSSALMMGSSYPTLKLFQKLRQGSDDISLGSYHEQSRQREYYLIFKSDKQRHIHLIENELLPLINGIQKGQSLNQIANLPVFLKNPNHLVEALSVIISRGWISR